MQHCKTGKSLGTRLVLMHIIMHMMACINNIIMPAYQSLYIACSHTHHPSPHSLVHNNIMLTHTHTRTHKHTHACTHSSPTHPLFTGPRLSSPTNYNRVHCYRDCSGHHQSSPFLHSDPLLCWRWRGKLQHYCELTDQWLIGTLHSTLSLHQHHLQALSQL